MYYIFFLSWLNFIPSLALTLSNVKNLPWDISSVHIQVSHANHRGKLYSINTQAMETVCQSASGIPCSDIFIKMTVYHALIYNIFTSADNSEYVMESLYPNFSMFCSTKSITFTANYAPWQLDFGIDNYFNRLHSFRASTYKCLISLNTMQPSLHAWINTLLENCNTTFYTGGKEKFLKCSKP